MSLLRSRRFGKKAPIIHPGHEQPLSHETVFKGEGEDKQGFHYGWFLSLILAGFAGASLILGALYIANGRNFASIVEKRGQPQVNSALSSGLIDNSKAGARKSGRLQILPLLSQIQSEKETVTLTKIALINGRQVIQPDPYTRIDTALARARSPLSDDIPPFNPASMMTAAADIQENLNSDEDKSDFIPETENYHDTNVILTLTQFDPNSDFTDTHKLGSHYVHQDIMGYITPTHYATGNYNADLELKGRDYTLYNILNADAADSQLKDVQIAYFKKTPFSELIDNISYHNDIAVKPDDELSLLLQSEEVKENDIIDIIAAISLRFDVNDLTTGQILRIGYGFTKENDLEERPLRVQIVDENRTIVVVALSTNNRYVPLEVSGENEESDTAQKSISLYYSLYETALRAKVPRDVTDQLVRIFSFDMDYNRQVQPNDRLKLVFDRAENELDQAKLIYASLMIDGQEKALYRFQTPDDGYIDYYDENGQSPKRFLLRKPMHAGEFRSGYGMRRHPIYRTMRMHNGVDWRAPTGTAIVAAGDGVVVKASWAGGYGRQVQIRHKYGYVSSYSHMSRYGANIHEGAQVRQGQIIGYVGTSGLSTGPHLHYELLVNKRHVDPMGVRLPRGRDLKGDMQAAFEQQKQRIKDVWVEGKKEQFADLRP